MAAKDATVRRLAAAVASNQYRAHPEQRARRRCAPAVPDALRERYEAEVDPEGVLPARTRRLRANAAWRRDEAQRALDAHRALLASAGGDAPDAA